MPPKRKKASDDESDSQSEFLDSDTERKLSPRKRDRSKKKKAKRARNEGDDDPRELFPFKNPDYEVVPTSNRRGTWRNLRQILAQSTRDNPDVALDVDTYSSIECPPSTIPPKKYCDLTGLLAKYTDPATKLRYHSADQFHSIRKMNDETVQQYLKMRNATTVIQ